MSIVSLHEDRVKVSSKIESVLACKVLDQVGGSGIESLGVWRISHVPKQITSYY